MNVATLLSPHIMRSLGWSLLHFLWQGTALAAMAAVGLSVVRRASARYLLSVGVLLLMVGAPVATFIFYWRTDPAAIMTSTPVQTPPSAALNAAQANGRLHISTTAHRVPPDIFPWMVEAWLAGVAFFGLRTAGGFVVLERMRRKQSIALSVTLRETCLALQHRLGLTRVIEYCHCHWLDAPAVIGWVRPIVLLPVTALTGLSEAQLHAVIAHELAHIKRLDSFVNAFQVAVETLLFYHPAVWWLNHRIRIEREHCCDDVAISLCGDPVEYARALTLMEEWRIAPALAMAANRGSLTARVTRLLGINHMGSGLRSSNAATSILCLTAALLAGNAFVSIAHPVSAQTVAAPASLSHTPLTSVSPVTPPSPLARLSPQSKPTPARAASPAQAAEPAQLPTSDGSYIDSMKAAGIGDITVDQWIGLKIQNVTPAYVRGIREQGLNPNVDELIGMRIQGVTPEFIRDIRSAGITVSEDQIVALRIQGVTADYLHGLQSAGLHPDADDLVSMKIQGVTPAYVQGLREQGFQPDAEQIVGMRIQGVTPEFARDVRALGLTPSAEDLISMRIQQVTPDYIKALQAAGLKFDVDEVVGAKIQGITPEFIEKAKKHGFQNLTLDKLIHLKHSGVLENAGEI